MGNHFSARLAASYMSHTVHSLFTFLSSRQINNAKPNNTSSRSKKKLFDS